MTETVKDRIIAAIGDQTIERPRELQLAADQNEHHIVHVLYSLNKQGLVKFRQKRSVHSPGVNLTNIKLTPAGKRMLKKNG